MTPEERQKLYDVIAILESVYNGNNPKDFLSNKVNQQDRDIDVIYAIISELTALAREMCGPKENFWATIEQVAAIETRPRNITLGTFAGKINNTINKYRMHSLKESDITEWLLLNDYISKESEEVTITEDYYAVNPKGAEAGIIEVEKARNNSDSPIHQLKLAQEAQQLIKDQIESISSSLRQEDSSETTNIVSDNDIQVRLAEESDIIYYKNCCFCQHNSTIRQAGDCHVIRGDADTCPDYRFISNPTEAEREAYIEFNRKRNNNRLRREGGKFKLTEENED